MPPSQSDRSSPRPLPSPPEAATHLPHRKRPCVECPWSRTTEPGMFPACRYDALRATTGRPGQEAVIGAPMFACHKSPEGRDEACAGWLAAVGHQHLGVRMAVVSGRLDAAALTPGPDWPALFDSYDEMRSTQDAPS